MPLSTPDLPVNASALPDLVDGLPVGRLIITEAHSEYVDAALTLKIPAIGINYSI